MPLITLAYVCLASGMLAGLSTGVVIPLAVSAVVGAVALITRVATPGAAAALFAAGVLAGAGSREQDTRCRRQGSTRAVWTADLLSDARPRSIARATWLADGCRMPLAIEVVAGVSGVGSRVRIEGRAIAGRKGVVIREARVVRLGPGALLPRWRAAIGRRIDSLFGSDAQLARALLIAEQGALPPKVRDAYADAGLVHILSVSGLHVAIVASAVHLLLTMIRLRPTAAIVGGALLTACYVMLIGAPPAALRAGGMLAAMSLGKVLQRPVSAWALLAIGALLPLHDPRIAADLGYQLSVAGMAAVVCSGAINRRFLVQRYSGLRRKLAGELTTALLAAALTGPLVAAAFGRLSLVSPLANLVAAPLVALAQPALFLALALSPFGTLAGFIAEGGRVPLALLERVATTAASVPFAAVSVAPRSAVCVLLLVAGSGVLVACSGRRPLRGLIGACIAVAAAAWWPERGSGETEFHMLDVGQGDALAIRTAKGRWVVMDAGRDWDGGDAGRATVAPYLRRRGGEVAAFIMSHPHSDHVGGGASVIRILRPRMVLDPGFRGDGASYLAALEAARLTGTAWRQARAGDRLVFDEVAIDVLAPDSGWVDLADGPNNASVVLLVRVGAVRFLLTGDAEAGAERRLLEHGDSLGADVLKAGHHGSATSSTPALLDAVRPRLALMSVGALNRYGHPSEGVLHELTKRRAVVLRTDLSGTIVVRTDGRRITVETEEETWDLPPAPWRN